MTGDDWLQRRSRILRQQQRLLRGAGTPTDVYTPDPKQDRWARGLGVDHVLHVRYTVEERTFDLFAAFPDHFPSFPPVVFAPNETFERHQDPHTTALCLVRDASHWDAWHWDPTTDSLLTLLNEQLPKFLKAQTATPEEARTIEVVAPEPRSMYYEYVDGTHVVIDSAWEPGSDTEGTLIVALPAPRRVHPVHCLPLIRGFVLEMRNKRGGVVARADQRLLDRYDDAPTLTARWVKVSEKLAMLDADAFKALLEGPERRMEVSKRQRYEATDPEAPQHPKHLDMCAILTDEEVGHGKYGTGWTFLVRAAKSHHPHAPDSPFLVPAVRAGPSDLAQRIPELGCVPHKTVVVVGLGGVGSFSALELARAGVGRLILIDPDVVEAGNSVRWAFGFDTAGFPKAHVVADFVRRHHPFTNADAYIHTLGKPRLVDGKPEGQFVDGLMKDADLVLDATGERNVHLMLADRAKAHGVPFVLAHTTFGGWGGMVARVCSDHDACIWCFQCHVLDQEDGIGSNGTDIVLPPADLEGEIALTGCSAPTFAGAGFDTARVAQPAAQLAVSTLCDCGDGGYPQAEWDVATLSLRDKTGRILEPRWYTARLTPHPRCCGADEN